MIRFAEATLVIVQCLPDQRIVQKIAERRIFTWKKRNEKRRRGRILGKGCWDRGKWLSHRLGKLLSFFWGKIGYDGHTKNPPWIVESLRSPKRAANHSQKRDACQGRMGN
jgi:hypothetical protein